MSRKPNKVIKLSETLSLADCHDGFWLYDETRGMNLSMRAKSETEAFVEALTYYQEKLIEVESKFKDIEQKVTSFVTQFLAIEY